MGKKNGGRKRRETGEEGGEGMGKVEGRVGGKEGERRRKWGRKCESDVEEKGGRKSKGENRREK